MDNQEEFLPNLFILGAAKCGTTTLHSYLGGFPSICMSDPKEPFFFEAYFDQGLEFYRKTYFKHWKGEKIIGEARHRNLILPYVRERIFSVNPQAKLIVIVRNPVERAYSHWYHNYARFSESLLFRQAIQDDYKRIRSGLDCSTDEEIRQHIEKLPRPAPGRVIGLGLYRTYVDSGYYYEQIKRYLSIFPAENLKVVLLDDLSTRPAVVLEELAAFLGISDPIPDNNKLMLLKNKHVNFPQELMPTRLKVKNRFRRLAGILLQRSKVRPTTPYEYFQDMKTFQWLSEHYRDHNDRLAGLIGKDLSHWNS